MKSIRAFHAVIILLLLIACTAPNADAQTVYITKTGAKYHRGSCQYLRKSKIEISMKEAVARGYDACSVCGPGTPSKAKTKPVPKPSRKAISPLGNSFDVFGDEYSHCCYLETISSKRTPVRFPEGS